MLEYIQDAKNMENLAHQMQASESDYSLIINTSNGSAVHSFEFSSTLGMKIVIPDSARNFVSTNFYQNTDWDWGNTVPFPTDNATWIGVTRRNNLLKLLANQNAITLENLKSYMDTSLENKGANWNMTIYQIIYQPTTKELWMKSPKHSVVWERVNVAGYFAIDPAKPKIEKASIHFPSSIAAVIFILLRYFM